MQLGLYEYMKSISLRRWDQGFKRLASRGSKLGHVVHCEFLLSVESADAQEMYEIIK